MLAEWCLCFLIHEVCHSFPSKEQASFNFMAAVTIHGDFGDQEKKQCHCFQFFPFYLPWSDGTECHDLSFFNVELQASFFALLFTLIKRLPNFSSFSAFREVSSAYLRLLTFLLAILIPTCDSSTLAFHMMYSTYKLNKYCENIHPCCTLFPLLNQLFHVQF